MSDQDPQEPISSFKEYNHQIIEAYFFSSGEPLSIKKLAKEFGTQPKDIRKIVRKLSKNLREQHGELILSPLEYDKDKWVLHLDIRTEYLEIIQDLLAENIPKITLESPLLRKFLTVIAYHEPISQAKLWKILAQDMKIDIPISQVDTELQKLMKEGLIRPIYKARSTQYETTQRFDKEFGFSRSRKKKKSQLANWMQENNINSKPSNDEA